MTPNIFETYLNKIQGNTAAGDFSNTLSLLAQLQGIHCLKRVLHCKIKILSLTSENLTIDLMMNNDVAYYHNLTASWCRHRIFLL